MQQLDFHAKRPNDTLRVTFDFRPFVAAISPDTPKYIGHGDTGPGYKVISNVGGLITLDITGGALGRVYVFGYEVTTSDGTESVLDIRRLRIREPNALPVPRFGSEYADDYADDYA